MLKRMINQFRHLVSPRAAAMGVLTVALVGGGLATPSTYAQEEDADALVTEDTAESPPTPTNAAPPLTGETTEATGETRSLLDTIVEGGIVGLLIILLSMVSVGFIVEHSLTIRKSVLMPEPVIDEMDRLIEAGQIDQALDVCYEPQNQCLATHVVAAGLERYKGSEFGFAEYKAAVEEAGEDQTGQLYRKTEVLGLIGSIAPMLGLTGTVLGMIKAFNAIAASGGMAKPDELAGGIGQALVTTLMGLVVAIPTMIAFSYFRNKIDSIVAEAGKRIEQILMPLGRRKA